MQRQTKLRIHDHAQQRTASRFAGAIGQQRIIGDDGANPDQDGVVLVAQFLHMGARLLAGDPSAGSASSAKSRGIVGLAGRRSDFAIQRHGRF